MSSNTFHVLGPGSIGLLWAHSLAKLESDVKLIGRETSSRRRLESTISCSYPGAVQTSMRTEFERVTPSSCTAIDILLVCVKSYQLKEALESVRHAIEDTSTVILLQNGMGHSELAQSLLPTANILLASNTHGAYRTTQFDVTYAGQGQTLIGPATPKVELHGVTELLHQLNQALPPVIWSQNIVDRLWQKLAINAVINSLTAKLQCRNGELLTNAQYYKQAKQMMGELKLLFAKVGKQHLVDSIQSSVDQVARQTANNKSSMLQDRLSQRLLEIDAISGFILQKAREAQVAMPFLQQTHEFLSNIHIKP